MLRNSGIRVQGRPDALERIGIIKFTYQRPASQPRAELRDLAAGRLTPRPQRVKRRVQMLFNDFLVVVVAAAAAPRSGAHSFEYTDRRPASGTFKQQRVQPPLNALLIVVVAAPPRSGAHSFDYMDRRPASGAFKTLSRRQANRTPGLSSSSLDSVCCFGTGRRAAHSYVSSSGERITCPSRVAHVDDYTYRRPAAGELFAQSHNSQVSTPIPSIPRLIFTLQIENFSAARPSSPLPTQNSIFRRPPSDTSTVLSEIFFFPLRGALATINTKPRDQNSRFRIPASETLSPLVFRFLFFPLRGAHLLSQICQVNKVEEIFFSAARLNCHFTANSLNRISHSSSFVPRLDGMNAQKTLTRTSNLPEVSTDFKFSLRTAQIRVFTASRPSRRAFSGRFKGPKIKNFPAGAG
ncbi:hypothetical protein R3P38DRAFT_2792035 [Favolaschia claudopus]|uniref:Uncharacterized protein n=1 Tax=Favolaschia claudopus TaxID=2862362 RepID=A0AAW0AGB4_9AGAR